VIDHEQMTWHHRRAKDFQEWIYGLGTGPFNSMAWAICILQHDGRTSYEITYYRALYEDGAFAGFLSENWDERVEHWPLGVEELKAYALWEWRTRQAA
jgi:hypothetical protein